MSGLFTCRNVDETSLRSGRDDLRECRFWFPQNKQEETRKRKRVSRPQTNFIKESSTRMYVRNSTKTEGDPLPDFHAYWSDLGVGFLNPTRVTLRTVLVVTRVHFWTPVWEGGRLFAENYPVPSKWGNDLQKSPSENFTCLYGSQYVHYPRRVGYERNVHQIKEGYNLSVHIELTSRISKVIDKHRFGSPVSSFTVWKVKSSTTLSKSIKANNSLSFIRLRSDSKKFQ